MENHYAATALISTISATPALAQEQWSLSVSLADLAWGRLNVDRGRPEVTGRSSLGSVYEGALFVLFEVIILKLKTSLKVTDEVMRSNHTNLQ